MKNQVLAYFKDLPKSKEAQYNEAFNLYKKCPEKSFAQERFYNQAGYSPTNLENLQYDLKKLVNLKDAEIRNAQKAIAKEKATPVIVLGLDDVASADINTIRAFLHQENALLFQVPTFEGSDAYLEMKSYVKENDIKTKSQKKVDLEDAINLFIDESIRNLASVYISEKEASADKTHDNPEIIVTAKSKDDVFSQAPDQVKETIKLRDEFPFLNEKDCPEEFYILVGKKFNHYDAYVKAHESLLVAIQDTEKDASPIALTPEEVTALALEAVEDFQINQDIWNELNYYKETGKVLGKHPIFVERKLKESVEALGNAKAAKRLVNLDSYIRRDAKKAEDAENAAEKEKYTQKVKEWQIEQTLIKAKYNL